MFKRQRPSQALADAFEFFLNMIHGDPVTEAEIKREFKAIKTDIADIKDKVDELFDTNKSMTAQINRSLRGIKERLAALEKK